MTNLGRLPALAIVAMATAPVVEVGPALATGVGDAGTPAGYWLTESRDAVIELAPCGNRLCGRIVGIGRKPDEPVPTDVHGRSQCGLTIIETEASSSPGVWTGTVTDPTDGSAYGARLWVDHDDRLHIRGYLGIPLFGETQIWTRFAGRLSEGCRMT